MADEEAFFIVISVDKPAGDAFGAVADHLPRLGLEHVNAVDSDLCPVVSGQR